jgi:hypothetical protein
MDARRRKKRIRDAERRKQDVCKIIMHQYKCQFLLIIMLIFRNTFSSVTYILSRDCNQVNFNVVL